MQPPTTYVGAKSRRDLGHRRHHDANDGKDHYPGVYSDTEYSKDDAIQPLRRKRYRVSAIAHIAGGIAP